MTDTEFEDPTPAATPSAAAGRRARRRPRRSTLRLLLVLSGLLVSAGSVVGFFLVAEELDERVPVTVAAYDIAVGDTITADALTFQLAHVGSIPHVPWSAGVPVYFDGLVAAQPIAAGGLIDFSMTVEPDTAAVGVQLALDVPLDSSLVPDGVFDGDLVLLIDPGAEPTGEEGADGRPRRVLREFTLSNFDGSRMRLYLEPEPWARWRSELDQAGGSLLVLAVPLGAGAEEMASQLDALWESQWSDAVAAAAQERLASQPPQAGPGELEVVVPLDESLVPSGIASGDLVLLIDPGAEPDATDLGRPRMVLLPLTLDNYEGGRVRLFVAPDAWLWWRSLPESLGAPPMVLPIPPGSDPDEVAASLDEEWLRDWRARVEGLDGPFFDDFFAEEEGFSEEGFAEEGS